MLRRAVMPSGRRFGGTAALVPPYVMCPQNANAPDGSVLAHPLPASIHALPAVIEKLLFRSVINYEYSERRSEDPPR